MTLSDGLTHRYELDETSGNRIDAVGVLDLPVVGTDTVSATTGLLTNCFDAVSSTRHLLVADDAGTALATEFTIACWVNQTTNPGGPKRLMGVYDNTLVIAALYLSGGGSPRFDARNSTSLIFPSFATPLIFNVWTHLAGTYSASQNQMILYVDGVGVAGVENDGLPLLANATPNFAIAANPAGSQAFDGLIDQALIYDRALNSQEVLDLWNFERGAFFGPVLDEQQSRRGRDLVMRDNAFLGVTLKVTGIDRFELWDRRTDVENPPEQRLRSGIGPVLGNWGKVRRYLDPTDTVLPAIPV